MSFRATKIYDLIKMASEPGAEHISANVLFLNQGLKEWLMPFLKDSYANLVNGYDRLYNHVYAFAR